MARKLLSIVLAVLMILTSLPAYAEPEAEETQQYTHALMITEPVTEPEAEPAAESETEPATGSETEPETAPEAEPAAESEEEPVTEPAPIEETEPETAELPAAYADECAHENAYATWTDIEWNQCVDLGDGTHGGYVREFSNMFCPDCELYFYEPISEWQYTVEEHAFAAHIGGGCVYCSAPNPCEHPNLFSDNWIRWDENFVDNGDGTHTGYGQYISYDLCPDCDGVYNYTESELQEITEEHIYSNGVCGRCGNVCQHDSMTVQDSYYQWDPDTVQNLDNGKHAGDRRRVDLSYCANCDQTYLVRNTWEYTEEDHEFENGVCSVCGALESPCAHEDMYEREVYDWITGPTSNGDGTHSGMLKVDTYMYCPDCKGRFDYTEGTAEEVTRDCEYQNGVCLFCDAVNPCSHENAYEESDSAWDEDPTPNGDGTHTGMYVEYTCMFCPDCGESFDFVWGTPEEVTERCFYDCGICEICGGENNCAHDRKRLIYAYNEYGDAPVDQGDGTHGGNGVAVTVYHCPDCDCDISEEGDPGFLTEKHIFNNGECDICGASNTCLHENPELVNEGIEWQTWPADNGDGTHSGVGYVVYSMYCPDCEEFYMEEGESGPITVPHEFFDGECGTCGAVNTCTHDNAPVTTMDTYTVSPFDNHDGTHSGEAVTVSYKLCPDCGERIELGESESFIMTREHCFEDGVCTECGAYEPACAHENATESTGYRYITDPQDNGDGTHSGAAVPVTYRSCPDCGESLGKVEGESFTLTQDHTYMDGVCTECGAVNTCDHANMRDESFIEWSYEGGTDNGDGTHTGYGIIVSYRRCPDCDGIFDYTRGELQQITTGHEYEAGVCYVCGACAHENVYEVEQDIEWFSCSDIGGGYHSGTRRLISVKYCPDCGAEVRELAGEWESVTEEHRFTAEGTCAACGAVNPCDHPNRYIRTTVLWNEGWPVDNGDGRHRGYGVEIHEDHCPDCYVTFNYEQETIAHEIFEDHDFRGGACIHCDLPCPHENKEAGNSYYEWDWLTVEDLGNGMHAGTRRTMTWYYCTACGDGAWEEGDWEYIEEEHDIQNNRCTVCSYNTCEHENVRYEPNRRWFNARAISEDEHTAMIMYGQDVICDDCGKYLGSLNGTFEWVTEPHSFNDEGECTICYCPESIAECPHVNTCVDSRWYETDWTDEGDGLHHTTSGYDLEYEQCEDCGMILWEEVIDEDSFSATHSYTKNYDGTLTCEYCGYVNTCLHENTYRESEIEITDWDSAENNGDGTHKVWGYTYSYTECADCGYTFDWVYGEEGYVNEPHRYENYDPDTGCNEPYCSVCGAENTCTHPNGEFLWEEGFYYTEVPVAIDDACHGGMGMFTGRFECPDCGMAYRDDLYPEYIEEQHRYDEDGFCDICGHVCQCDHPSIYERVWYSFEDDAVDLGNGKHGGSGTRNKDFYCEVCGLWLGWEEGDYGYYETEHEFDGGECMVCGASCPHDEAGVDVYEGTSEIDSVLDTTETLHTLRIRKEYPVSCKRCGMRAGYTTAYSTVTEPHAFDENGVCTVCGYESGCLHENAETVTLFEVAGDEYISQGAAGHAQTMAEYTAVFCPDCGRTMNKTATGRTFTGRVEGHWFNSRGECGGCGYKAEGCTHPNLYHEQYESYDWESIVQIDDGHHKVTKFTVSDDYCPDCGKQMGTIRGTAYTVTEAHDFDADGICYICGYFKPCAHTHKVLTSVSWSTLPMAVSHDEMTHITYTQDEYIYTCSDCGAQIVQKSGEYKRDIANHEYYDGTSCIICGYTAEPGCAHEHAWQVATYYRNYTFTSVDKKSHRVTAEVDHERWLCRDCGAEFDMPAEGTCTWNENHDFNGDGVCYECGYKNTCAHKNKTTTTVTVSISNGADIEYHVKDTYTHTDTVCKDCGATVTGGAWTLTEKDVKERHVFDENDYCTYCGLTLPYCEHEYEDGYCTKCGKPESREIAVIDVYNDLVLGVGEKKTVEYGLLPDNAEGNITFKSSKTTVATVNASTGLVTAKAAGTAVITLVADNGITATCKVTVKAAPTAIKLNKTAATLAAGETLQLGYTLTPSTAATTVTWTSSDPAVADVDENGFVTALAAGTATITAKTHNGKPATCKLTVKNAPEGVELTADKTVLGVGMTAQLTATLLGENAGGAYTYSTDSEFITLTDAGKVTAVKPGTAEITVTTCNDKTDTITITVKNAPDAVTLNETAVTLGVGMKFTIVPEASFEGSTENAMTTYSYKSSSTAIATVANGVVTAKAAGTATITVTSHNGVPATCKVTVKAAPTAIKLNKTAATLGEREELQLSYTLTAATAVTEITWESDNEAAAVVDENGLVTAVAPGTAKITVKTHNGKYHTCTVTVKNAPEGIAVEPETIEIAEQQTAVIAVSLLGEDAAGSYTFTADNENVTVSASGVVTGVAAGTATVTVTTYNSKSAAVAVTVVHAPDLLTLDATALTIGVGQKLTLGATPTFEGTEDCRTTLKFSSGKTSVATVDANTGVITGKAAGTATVTVRTHNGKSAPCKVTVKTAPTAIKLNKTAATLGEGETLQLSYTLSSGSATKVTYTSSNEEVAVVDADTGIVTAIAPGTATITGTTHNGKKNSCVVTVMAEPEGIAINEPASTEFAVGQKLTLTAALIGENVAGSYKFTSNDDTVSVTEAGVVTGVKAGTATVTVTAYNLESDTITLNIVNAPDTLVLDATALTIGVKQKITLGVTPTFEGSEENCMAGLTFKSGKTSVATVSAAGVITAKAVGTATITVTSHNGVKATCKVTVKAAPTAIKLSKAKATLGEDETLKLGYTLTAKTAATAVTWDSDNKDVAVVDENGLVTALAVGTATITATTHNGKKGTCAVTVKAAPEGISIIVPEVTDFAVGQRITLSATLLGEDVAGTYKFASSDDTVTVTEAGVVTGVETGSATVTVTTHNGKTDTIYLTVVNAPDTLLLDATALTLGIKQKVTLDVTPTFKGSEDDCMTNLTFKSSKTSVATVNAAGVITAKAKGTATITVTSHNGVKATCKVTVKAAPTSVKVSPAKVTIAERDTLQLGYKLSSGSAGAVTFTVPENQDVATVSETGLLTANVPGTVTVTATAYNGKSGSCVVTVVAEPKGITINEPASTVFAEQQSITLSAALDGEAGSYWFYSDDENITVTEAGVVTGVTAGTATVCAETYNGKTDTIEVTVVPAPTALELSATALTLKVKGKATLTATPIYEGTDEGMTTLTFKSSKTSVATVNAAGVITAKAKGTATITVTSHNGVKATCKVTVK